MKSVKNIVLDGLKYFRQQLLSADTDSTDTTHGLSLAGAKNLQDQINTLNQSGISHVGTIIFSTTLSTEAMVQAIYGQNTSWIQHTGYFLRGASSGVTSNNAIWDGGSDDSIIPYHNHVFTGTEVTSGNQTANHQHTVNGGSCTTGNQSANHSHGFTLYKVGGAANGSGTAYNTYMSLAGSNNLATGNNNVSHTHSVPNHTHSVGNQSANHQHKVTADGTISYAGTDGNTINGNIPKYKSVYIWERIA